MTGEARMLIDGRLVSARSGATFVNINPATEEVLGSVADAGLEEVDAALTAARRAFDETDWATDRDLRKRCLVQLHDALTAEREQVRAEIVAEVGTPVGITGGLHVDAGLEEFAWVPGFMDAFPWERELAPSATAAGPSWRRVVKEPVGVVVAIVPWNVPLECSLMKVGPALATGNTVILKAAPDTPWNATRIGRLAAERTDITPGVLR